MKRTVNRRSSMTLYLQQQWRNDGAAIPAAKPVAASPPQQQNRAA